MSKTLAAFAVALATVSLGASPQSDESLVLKLSQDKYLWLEPMIATLLLDSDEIVSLPVAPEKGKLRFTLDPPLKPRANAKPLTVESKGAGVRANLRKVDLFEWYSFPQKGGSWTVTAVLTRDGREIASKPVRLSMAPVAKGNPDFLAMRRLHHPPWSNYEVNKFCGDTFDLAKRWPESRLAKYSHYWSARYSQNNKKYDEAIASYKTVVEKYPDFILVDHAGYGIVECLLAQKKSKEAKQALAKLLHRCKARAEKEGLCCSTRTTVQALALERSKELAKGAD